MAEDPGSGEQLRAGSGGHGVVGREPEESVDLGGDGDGEGADVAPLIRQRRHGHAPAAVLEPHQARGGHVHLVEEDLVEGGAARHLPDRSHLHALTRHIE